MKTKITHGCDGWPCRRLARCGRRQVAVKPTVSTDLSLSRLGSVLTVAMVGRRYLISSNEALLPRLGSSGLKMGHRQPMTMS